MRTRSQIARRSKVRGSTFERLVAKKIVLASGLERQDCYRTPLSGGHEFAGASDLVISPRLRESFPFCVECKHRKNFRLEHVFDQVTDFRSYHAQVLEACQREGNTRQPLVVIRGQGGHIFASLPSAHMVASKLVLPDDSTVMSYRCEGRRWVMTDLDNFLLAIFKRQSASATA